MAATAKGKSAQASAIQAGQAATLVVPTAEDHRQDSIRNAAL